MPKMTRVGFAVEVQRVWQLARNNFDRDQHLTGAILGYDAMSRQTMFMAMTNASFDDPDERATVLGSGMVPVRGSFENNIDAMQALLRKAGVVAAVRVAEAWYAGDDTALDVVALGMAPGAHPMSDEVALVAGFWPREHFTVYCRAVITRDEHGGNPALGPDLVLDGPQMEAVSWLKTVLPQPY